MEKKHGPWIIKTTTSKYKNDWITVTEDKVFRPDGKPGIFAVVTMVPGISVLPLDDEGMVYLVEEFQYAIGKNSVETVSGGIHKGEQPQATAQRELQEELGIRAKEWIDLGVVNPFTSVVHSPAYLFLAKKLSFSRTKHEGTETVKLVKVTLERAVRMVLGSKITHAQSCVLILRAYSYVGESFTCSRQHFH